MSKLKRMTGLLVALTLLMTSPGAYQATEMLESDVIIMNEGIDGETSFKDTITYTDIALGEAVQVELASSNENVYFRFVPEESGYYKIFSSDQEGDPVGELYNAEGTVMSYADDEGEGNNFAIYYQLMQDEEYFICAKSYGEEGSSYALQVEKMPDIEDIRVGNAENEKKFLAYRGGSWIEEWNDETGEMERIYRYNESQVLSNYPLTISYKDGTSEEVTSLDDPRIIYLDNQPWIPGGEDNWFRIECGEIVVTQKVEIEPQKTVVDMELTLKPEKTALIYQSENDGSVSEEYDSENDTYHDYYRFHDDAIRRVYTIAFIYEDGSREEMSLEDACEEGRVDMIHNQSWTNPWTPENENCLLTVREVEASKSVNVPVTTFLGYYEGKPELKEDVEATVVCKADEEVAYLFTAKESKTYTFFSKNSPHMSVTLWNENGEELIRDEDSVFALSYELEADKVYVVRLYNMNSEDAEFELMVVGRKLSFEDMISYSDMELNVPVTVNITSSDERNYLRFVPQETGRYVFFSEMQDENDDPWAVLYDENGEYLTEGDDFKESRDYEFSYELTAQKEYFLLPKTYSTPITYKTVVEKEKTFAELIEDVQELAIEEGKTKSEEVTLSIGTPNPGTHDALVKFTPEEGGYYSFDVDYGLLVYSLKLLDSEGCELEDWDYQDVHGEEDTESASAEFVAGESYYLAIEYENEHYNAGYTLPVTVEKRVEITDIRIEPIAEDVAIRYGVNGYWDAYYDDETEEEIEYYHYDVSTILNLYNIIIEYADGSEEIWTADEDGRVEYSDNQHPSGWTVGGTNNLFWITAGDIKKEMAVTLLPALEVKSIEVMLENADGALLYGIDNIDGYWDTYYVGENDSEIEYFYFRAERVVDLYRAKIVYEDDSVMEARLWDLYTSGYVRADINQSETNLWKPGSENNIMKVMAGDETVEVVVPVKYFREYFKEGNVLVDGAREEVDCRLGGNEKYFLVQSNEDVKYEIYAEGNLNTEAELYQGDGKDSECISSGGDGENFKIVLNAKAGETYLLRTYVNGSMDSRFYYVCMKKERVTGNEEHEKPPAITPVYYDLGSVTVSKKSIVYNGKTQTPSVVVKDTTGKVVDPSNYTVTYANNKAVGVATITVTAKGNYRGTLTQTFEIVPKGTTLAKLSGKKKALTVKWKKQAKEVTGYEIQYATKKNFGGAKIKKVTKAKKTSVTIKRLKAKKKYYVRVRTYKTVKVNGKKHNMYSAWSKAKSIKTK